MSNNKKKSVWNQYINRVYKCTNCECVISYKEKVTKSFRKKCPLCSTNCLLFETADSPFTVFIDLNKPKTLGAISDQNIKRKEVERASKKKKKPWWRKTDKINFDILKNPTGYLLDDKI